MAQGNLVVTDPPPAPPRGKKARLMQDMQQSIDISVSGGDVGASGQSENNQARGGGNENSLPTPMSNSVKPAPLEQPTALSRKRKVEGCDSELVDHQNAGDGATNHQCKIIITPPTPPKLGRPETPPHGQEGYNFDRGTDIIIRNNNILLRVNSPSNSAISDSPLSVSGWDYAFYDQEQRRTGGCTGDHLERVTSPLGEERPTELVLAVQGASPEPPQPGHELPYPTPIELTLFMTRNKGGQADALGTTWRE